jgi:hypothetical protein
MFTACGPLSASPRLSNVVTAPRELTPRYSARPSPFRSARWTEVEAETDRALQSAGEVICSYSLNSPSLGRLAIALS